MSPIDPVGAGAGGVDPAAQSVDQLAQRLTSAGDDTELREAAKEFEALFLSKLIGEMFDSAQVGKDLPSGYRSMMEEKFADYMADAGGFGLQAVLSTQLSGNVPGATTAPVAPDQGDATTASPSEDTAVPAPAPAAPDQPSS